MLYGGSTVKFSPRIRIDLTGVPLSLTGADGGGSGPMDSWSAPRQLIYIK